MDENTPLIVPEVNEEDLHNHNGIIANPNCSTIQMVVALEPIRKAFGLNKVIVSTYQAVSGSGQAAIDELQEQTRAILDNQAYTPEVLPVKVIKNIIKSLLMLSLKLISLLITVIPSKK